MPPHPGYKQTELHRENIRKGLRRALAKRKGKGFRTGIANGRQRMATICEIIKHDRHHHQS